MAYNSPTPAPSLDDISAEIETCQALLKGVKGSASPDREMEEQLETRLASLLEDSEILQRSPSRESRSYSASDHKRHSSRSSTSINTTAGQASSRTSDQNPEVTNIVERNDHRSPKPSLEKMEEANHVSDVGPREQDVPVRSRKRHLSGGHWQSSSKIRRATPSPAITAPSTPNTTSEFDDVLGALLGSDFKDNLQDFEQEQRLWDLRQEQERRDEEFARSLQESWDSSDAVISSQPIPSFQAQLQPNRNSMLKMSPTLFAPSEDEQKIPIGAACINTQPQHHPLTLPSHRPYIKSESDGNNGSSRSSSSNSLKEISPSSFLSAVKQEYSSSLFNHQASQNYSNMAMIPQHGGSSVYSSNLFHSTSTPALYPYFGASKAYPQSSYSTNAGGASYDNYSFANPSTDNLPLDRLGGYPKVSDFDPLFVDPTKTHEELKSLLSNIRPDEDVHPESREGTPEAMKCNLMEHQKLGLAWMKKMEESSSQGGILADDMGLGKTVQALALIVSRKSPDPIRKTTLIVAPVALMGQWAREITKLLKPGKHSLTVEILHGNSRDLPWSKIREKDVVLTTYGTLTSEIKRKHLWEEKVRRVPDAKPTRPGENLPLLGEKSSWYRVILDEAQWIKNKSAKASASACHIKARYRWCLTGTPMQNSIDELYSLIRFLRISPYKGWEAFSRDFSRPLKAKTSYGSTKDTAMQQLQALLKAIMLRRTKDSKIDGKPIIQLPGKTLLHQDAVFSKDEQDFYRALEDRAQITFNRYVNAGTVGRNYSNALVLLLRLRQACCHPHLIKDMQLEPNTGPEALDKLANAQLLSPQVVERIKQVEAFECPICFDAAINSLIFNPCGHPSCNECFDRLTTTATANADSEAGSAVLCPTCRARVDPAKLTDFQSVKKIGEDTRAGCEGDILGGILSEAPDEDSESDSGTETDDGDDEVDANGNLANFVVADTSCEDGNQDVEDLRNLMTGSSAQARLRREGENFGTTAQFTRRSKPKSRQKGKGRASSTKHLSLAQLRKEGLKSKAAKRKYLRRLEKNFQTSAKIEKTMEIIASIEARGTNEKTIIFSQFTSLLDLLEVPLSRKDVQYKRYDGSMNRNDREDAVIAFSDDPQYTVLLVSLKAGNSGLNLTAASQVIIFDPHWNWYTEAQAIDRAYRIGQMKPVEVHRLFVAETVEDRILALQEKKKELIETALDEKAAKNVGRLGIRELGYLFGVNAL